MSIYRHLWLNQTMHEVAIITSHGRQAHPPALTLEPVPAAMAMELFSANR